jgi:CHAP domain
MTKLIAAGGGVLLIGATIVLLFTALFSGQMASYSGGVCVPMTATSTTVGISPTTKASPTGGVSCYPASGNGSAVSMAALTIAAHLYGNPDTWYDASIPQPVLQFWARACPSGSGCWVDWQEGSLQCVLLVTGAYALAGLPLPVAGNAIDFWTLYQHRPGWLEVPSAIAPTSQRGLPMPGDIMVWYDPPPLVGHVAIVVGVNPSLAGHNGSVTFAEANGPGPVVTQTLLPDLSVVTWSNPIPYSVLGYIRHVTTNRTGTHP